MNVQELVVVGFHLGVCAPSPPPLKNTQEVLCMHGNSCLPLT